LFLTMINSADSNLFNGFVKMSYAICCLMDVLITFNRALSQEIPIAGSAIDFLNNEAPYDRYCMGPK
jgi:hypothetical protein